MKQFLSCLGSSYRTRVIYVKGKSRNLSGDNNKGSNNRTLFES